MNEVESFITDFKKYNPKALEDTFYLGYCYWFAKILADRFQGEIWFNPDIVHFATYIECDNKSMLYDIFGAIRIGYNSVTKQAESKQWMPWEELQQCNPETAQSITDSCIIKK